VTVLPPGELLRYFKPGIGAGTEAILQAEHPSVLSMGATFRIVAL